MFSQSSRIARSAFSHGEMSEAGLPITEVRVDEPTLENTFVAKLRSLGQEIPRYSVPRPPSSRIAAGPKSRSARLISPKDSATFSAVKNVNLQVRYGEVYGLLGANGAGKTTTIKMLCGLLEPTQGAWCNSPANAACALPRCASRIGYMSQKFSLYDDLSIDENLDFFAGVYGVPERERDEKMRWVLSFSGLEGKQKQITGSLPGGWKQRVAFGAAIMHEPQRALSRRADFGCRSAGAPCVLDHDQPGWPMPARRFW